MNEEILTLIIVMNMKRHKRVARKLPAYLISLPGYQLRWCPAILCSIATIDRMCDCWMCDYLMRIWRFYLRFVRAGICVRTLCCSVKCDMLYDYVRADEDHRSASASRSLLAWSVRLFVDAGVKGMHQKSIDRNPGRKNSNWKCFNQFPHFIIRCGTSFVFSCWEGLKKQFVSLSDALNTHI